MKSSQFPINLQQYLDQEYEDNSTVHLLSVKKDKEGNIGFEIHAVDKEGFSLDFKVNRNNLTTVVYRKSVGAGTNSL